MDFGTLEAFKIQKKRDAEYLLIHACIGM